ncbi:MAG: maleylacetoacetate isomerase [Bdellovibrionia bacterium]
MNLQQPIRPLRLYHYWRSSSSWRVRWALGLKNVPFDAQAIDLLTDEADQPRHLERNPMGYVPVLEIPSATHPPEFLTESMAILEWLELVAPTPPLFPGDPLRQARIRQLCEIINSGTQPLQNPNVSAFHSPVAELQKKWNQTWIQKGLNAFEVWVKKTSGQYSVGDSITAADLFLIPQCYNALRNEISLELFPTIHRIYGAALKTEACQRSHPDQFQPSP